MRYDRSQPLRVTMEIGTLGYKRTEIVRNWVPGQEFWVDPDTISVIFEIFPKSYKKMVQNLTF